MRFDDQAIDTIFGALILIVSCFTSSGIIIMIDHNTLKNDAIETKLEDKFDLCLQSTISIERKVMNTTVRETVQLIDYLALNRNSYEPVIDRLAQNRTATQILELFNFYFSKYHFWQLSVLFSEEKMISIAQSGSQSEGSNVIVLERKVQVCCSDAYSIAFTIEM